MDVVTLYHFPSPLLATIAIDGIIHNIFEEISDSNAGVKVKDTTIDVKQETHATTKANMVYNVVTSYFEVGTSGAKREHLGNVKFDKPITPTSQSCTGPPLK